MTAGASSIVDEHLHPQSTFCNQGENTCAWNSTNRLGTEASRTASKANRCNRAPTHRERPSAGLGSAPISKAKPPGTATRPPDPPRSHRKKAPLAAEPYAVPLRSTASSSAAESTRGGGQNCTPIGGQFSTPIDRPWVSLNLYRTMLRRKRRRQRSLPGPARKSCTGANAFHRDVGNWHERHCGCRFSAWLEFEVLRTRI